MTDAKKPAAKEEITDRSRLTYITVRLQELASERTKLIEERKALVEKRRSARQG